VATWSYPSVTDVRKQIEERNDGTRPAEPYQRIAGSILEGILRARLRAHPLVESRDGWRLTELNGTEGILTDLDGVEHRVAARYVGDATQQDWATVLDTVSGARPLPHQSE
jgi:hypothetical protein